MLQNVSTMSCYLSGNPNIKKESDMLKLSHKQLIVWEKSLELVQEVYTITEKFPVEEKYGLVSQLKRAAVSVVSNISEGEARRSGKEKRRFYEFSRSSLVEIDAQFEVALLLEFVSEEELKKLTALLNECFAMLSKLRTTR